MTRPFLRPSEESRVDFNRDNKPTPGVRVILADGRRFFFTGGTVQLATSMARLALDGGELDEDGTRVEYGLRSGDAFIVEKVIKSEVRYAADA